MDMTKDWADVTSPVILAPANKAQADICAELLGAANMGEVVDIHTGASKGWLIASRKDVNSGAAIKLCERWGVAVWF